MIRNLQGDDRTDSGAFVPIERPRLVERLSVSASFPIALLVAPAGYGKSVVLRQYLRSLRQPCARFALRAEYATLLSFLRGFAEALGGAQTRDRLGPLDERALGVVFGRRCYR